MKFEELMNDVSFQEQLSAAAGPEEVVALFAAKGIDVPVEIAAEVFAPVSADGELSEDALEDVAGGCLGGSILYHLCYIGNRVIKGMSKKEARQAASDLVYDTFSSSHRHGWGIDK